MAPSTVPAYRSRRSIAGQEAYKNNRRAINRSPILDSSRLFALIVILTSQALHCLERPHHARRPRRYMFRVVSRLTATA